MWMDEAGKVGGHQTARLGGHAEDSGLCPESSGRLLAYFNQGHGIICIFFMIPLVVEFDIDWSRTGAGPG